MGLLGRDQVAYMMSDIYTLSIMCIQCTYVTIINGGMHGHATIRWLLYTYSMYLYQTIRLYPLSSKFINIAELS